MYPTGTEKYSCQYDAPRTPSARRGPRLRRVPRRSEGVRNVFDFLRRDAVQCNDEPIYAPCLHYKSPGEAGREGTAFCPPSILLFLLSRAHKLFRGPHDPAEEEGHEQRRDKGRNEHTADDAGADGVAAGRARARTDGKGHAAEDEGQRSHHDGPETQTGGFFGRVHRVLAFVTVLLDGKFHDQDGVFRRHLSDRGRSHPLLSR